MQTSTGLGWKKSWEKSSWDKLFQVISVEKQLKFMFPDMYEKMLLNIYSKKVFWQRCRIQFFEAFIAA